MSKVVLSSIIDIVSGGTPKTSVPKYWNGDIGWLSVTDFNNDNRFVYNTEKTITEKGVKESNTKFLNVGEIIISARGTVGALAQIGKPMCFNQSCFGLRGKKNLVENDYLFYALKNYVKNIVKRSQGSVFDTINLASFDLMELDIHSDISTQKSIAKVLSDLDAKIELNNRINRELEAMAKTLYDYWFVQFDFPAPSPSGRAGEGLPYKSSGGKMMYNAELKREIPVGWEVKPLAKITDVSNESVNPMLTPEKEFKHYSIPTYDASRTYGIEKGIDIRSNKFVVAESDILVSKLNPWFTRVIYPIKEDDLICSTEFVVWRTSNTNIKNYLFMVGKGEHFILHCSQSATGTSNSHKRVNPSVMMRYKVPFNSELIQKFGATINSWIKIGINKQLENQQLSELRDWLLPMLMNGQVTVKEAEERLSMAAEPNVEYKKG